MNNANADPNTEYLSDGLADSIINGLSQLSGLRVTSLSSVLRYKDQPKGGQADPQAILRDPQLESLHSDPRDLEWLKRFGLTQ